MVNEFIEEFLEEHKDLIKSISENIMCPSCNKIVKPPFFNLVDKWNSSEGCEECYEKL